MKGVNRQLMRDASRANGGRLIEKTLIEMDNKTHDIRESVMICVKVLICLM